MVRFSSCWLQILAVAGHYLFIINLFESIAVTSSHSIIIAILTIIIVVIVWWAIAVMHPYHERLENLTSRVNLQYNKDYGYLLANYWRSQWRRGLLPRDHAVNLGQAAPKIGVGGDKKQTITLMWLYSNIPKFFSRYFYVHILLVRQFDFFPVYLLHEMNLCRIFVVSKHV